MRGHIADMVVKNANVLTVDDLNTVAESFAVKNTFNQVQFYIEIESHIEDSALKKALEELGFHTQQLDILGVYEAAQYRLKNK